MEPVTLTRSDLEDIVTAAVVRALRSERADQYLSSREASALIYGRPELKSFTGLRQRHPSLDEISVGEGRLRRWKRSALEAWMATHRQHTTP